MFCYGTKSLNLSSKNDYLKTTTLNHNQDGINYNNGGDKVIKIEETLSTQGDDISA